MPIDVPCPCGRRFRVADHLAGRTGKCPQCGAHLHIGSVGGRSQSVSANTPPNFAHPSAAPSSVPWAVALPPVASPTAQVVGPPGYANAPRPAWADVRATAPARGPAPAKPRRRWKLTAIVGLVVVLSTGVGAWLFRDRAKQVVAQVAPGLVSSTYPAWDSSRVPTLSIPGKETSWQPFYKQYDFALTAGSYRQDPAFAYLTLRRLSQEGKISWNEGTGAEQKRVEHEITAEQKAWLTQAAGELRPAALDFCRRLTAKALHDEDVRIAVAATLLWMKVEHLERPPPKDTAETLSQVAQFLAGEERSRVIDLLRSEFGGKASYTRQWEISSLKTEWRSQYSKQHGLSTLTISPPEGRQFLYVRAQVRCGPIAEADPTCLPFYQDAPRNFRAESAVDWWRDGVEQFAATPPADVPLRRLLTVDMVNLVGSDSPTSPATSTLFSGFIPCNIVGDECNVLRGVMCDVMMMLLTISNRAANPTLLSSGSWIGPETQFPLELYFAVPKSAEIDYSLYLMGAPPVKLPQPKSGD